MEIGFYLAVFAVVGFGLVLWAASRDAEPVRGKPEVFVAADWWADKVREANLLQPEPVRLTDEQVLAFSKALAYAISEHHDDHRQYPRLTYTALNGALHPVLEAARQRALTTQRGFCHPDGPSLPRVLKLPLPQSILEMDIEETAVTVRERAVILNERALKHFGFVKEDDKVPQPEFQVSKLEVTPFPT